jgi:hypothetical protein
MHAGAMIRRGGLAAVACAALVAGACGARQAPPVLAIPMVPLAKTCVAADEATLNEAGALADEGKLDEALQRLEELPGDCAETASRVAEAQSRLVAALDAGHASMADMVQEGWAAWETGNKAAGLAAFSRAIRAGIRNGEGPRVLPLRSWPFMDGEGNVKPILRVDEHTLLAGAAAGDLHGGVLLRYRRAGDGVHLHPLRFLGETGTRVLRAVGPEGRFAIVAEDQGHLAPSSSAPALPLPGGGAVFITDHGASVVIADDSGIQAFDGSTATPRAPRQPLALQLLSYIQARPERPLIARCPGYEPLTSETFVLDAHTGKLLARMAPGRGCALDVAHGHMVVLHVEGEAPHVKTSLEIQALGSDAPPRTVRLDAGDDDSPALSIDAASGLISVMFTVKQKLRTAFIDPDTGRPVKPPPAAKRAPPTRLDSIPVGEADFIADLAFLDSLVPPPRAILPNFSTPNLHAWTANGARSPDHGVLALVDHDPNADTPDEDLLLFDTATLTLRHRVDLLPSDHAWLFVAFIDDSWVTVRQEWATHIVHVPSGTLRATVDVSDVGGELPSLLGDDLAASGNELIDLSRPRDVEHAGDAVLALPLDVSSPEKPPSILPDGRIVPPVPYGVHCALGEWVLPFEACAHRLVAVVSKGKSEARSAP